MSQVIFTITTPDGRSIDVTRAAFGYGNGYGWSTGPGPGAAHCGGFADLGEAVHAALRYLAAHAQPACGPCAAQ